MPTETFFRLPEQKREKLIDAVKAEFIRVPFSEISINRIVQQAEIPRGSFYQYFRDKEDLMQYVLQQCHEKVFAFLKQQMQACHGDLLRVAITTYDRISLCTGTETEALLQQLLGNLRMRDHRFVNYLHTLRNEAFTQLFPQSGNAEPCAMSREALELAVDLMETAVCGAIAERFTTTDPPNDVRDRLEKKLKMILRGLAQQKENNDAI